MHAPDHSVLEISENPSGFLESTTIDDSARGGFDQKSLMVEKTNLHQHSVAFLCPKCVRSVHAPDHSVLEISQNPSGFLESNTIDDSARGGFDQKCFMLEEVHFNQL